VQLKKSDGGGIVDINGGHRRNWSYCNLQRKKLRDLKPAADRGTGAREKVARSLRSRSTTKYLYRYRGSTNVKNLQTGPIFPYIIGSPIKKQAQQSSLASMYLLLNKIII
jgi:hypothetical protein